MLDNKIEELKFEYSIVGFLDILGFSAMVKSDTNGTTPKFLHIFKDVFEELESIASSSSPTVKMFSDSIIIEAELSSNNLLSVIDVSAQLQRLFLKRGILLRGGVAHGKHYSKKNIMFSEALINAYLIESKMARFPRIVIEENLLSYIWHHADTDNELRDEFKKKLIVDRDKAKFVDFLSDENIVSLSSSIKSCLLTNITPEETVLEKMRWLIDYHNHCAKLCGTPELDAENFNNGFSLIEIIK